ncbi:MAG: SCO family protein [Planctomycetota bacterium]|nr:SCO family protein [Planctomycetota bacterium]
MCRLAVTLAFVLAGFVAIGSDVRGQLLTDIPERAKDIRIDEKRGETLPSDLTFINERGKPALVGKFGDGKKPFLLTLNYSNCPGLCTAQLNGLTEGLAAMRDLELGKDFRVFSISIDPRETQEKMAAMKDKYVAMLPKQHQAAGWSFLHGDRDSIARIADAIGFRYTYDAANDRYNHASAAILVTPDGKISRYLFEIGFKPETLRFGLIEASEGRIGSMADQILLSCFHYNPEEGSYAADARKLLAYGAGAFVIVGLAISVPFWIPRKLGGKHSSLADSDSGENAPAIFEPK